MVINIGNADRVIRIIIKLVAIAAIFIAPLAVQAGRVLPLDSWALL